MFEPDTRNDCNLTTRNCGAIEPAAHTRLENSDIHALFCIMEEGNQRQDFKKRGFYRRHACGNTARRHGFCGGFHLQQQAVQIDHRNRNIVDSDTLLQANQVRAHIQTRLEPMRLQYAREVITGGALPVRADHVNRPELFLGIAKSVAKRTRRFEPGNHPEHQARFQIFHTG